MLYTCNSSESAGFYILMIYIPDCIQSYAGIFADDTKLYHPIFSPDDSDFAKIMILILFCSGVILGYTEIIPKCHYNTIGRSSPRSRHPPIMLKILPIMLCCTAQYYAQIMLKHFPYFANKFAVMGT